MERSIYLIGKTESDNTALWLPLWMHLKDTADIMNLLVLRWLPDSTKRAMEMSEDELSAVARFLGAIHDIGKATVLFQSNISQSLPEARLRLERCSPLTCNESIRKKTTHAMAGEAILSEMRCPGGVASIVGAHHGKPQSSNVVDVQIESYTRNYYPNGYKAFWQSCWKEIIDFALKESGYKDICDLPILTQPVEILLTGLLIMADWIASNTDFFPLIPEEDLGREEMYPNRIDSPWFEKLKLSMPWEAQMEVAERNGFKNRFGFSPNSVQRAATDIACNIDKPGMLILEAPMGIGKTEAGLAAAEIFAACFGAGGIFFGLPTQATTNGIFPRLLQWAEKQSDDICHSIRLAHGMAEFNEDYINLQASDVKTDDDTDDKFENVTVNQWFCGNKKALLADFVIGTVDQLLMSALLQKHVMLRQLGLVGKVVLIDEVHAYDAYMNQYLDRALEWLGWYKVPVILLSATLPAKRRLELIKAYQPNAENESENISSSEYPLLTWTDGEKVKQYVPDIDTKSRKVLITHVTENDILSILKEKMRNGGCAGVIVNTVRKAQTIAEELRQGLPDKKIVLFHSRFLMPDRTDKENELMRLIGKSSASESRNNLIVVGTQVLEQSIDVDFDFMISELCPMDLLLQRIGRLHRHLRNRPEPMQHAVCTVLDTEDAEFDKGSRSVYGEWLLWRTRQLLPSEIVLPQDISVLVQKAYGWENDDVLKPDVSALAMREEYERKRDIQKHKADAYVVQRPEFHERCPDRNTLDDWMPTDFAKNEEASRAAVRDGEASIEVLLMMRKADGSIHFLPWQEGGRQVEADCPPNPETACKIARQRLRLPGFFSKAWNADNVIGQLEADNIKFLSAWQLSPMLKGELVLLLDDKLSACLGNIWLHYTIDNGLIYNTENDDERH